MTKAANIIPFWKRFLDLPFGVQWRFLIVRAPWLVPLFILRFSSTAPYPFVLYLPSRGRHKIPVWIFLPPEITRRRKRLTDGNASSKRPTRDDADAGDPPYPVHLDFHGGGFFMGSPHEQSPYCSMLARETGRIVLSVDYRMGPLEQFPSATYDAEDVLAAVLDSEGATPAGRALRKDIAKRVSHHRFPRPGMTMKTKIEGLIDSTRVSVSGFSSGGNIALNLILSVKDWPSLFPKDWPNPIPTLLFFPSFDQTLLPHERPEQGTDPNSFMSRNAAVMTPYWLPGDLKNHPRANPGLCEMSGLHPKAEIFLVLPEHDSLAVQSDEWVQKMREQGKEACLVVRREKGMKHGWTQFPDTFLAGHEKGRKQDCVKASVEFVRLADDGVPCFERKISRADGC